MTDFKRINGSWKSDRIEGTDAPEYIRGFHSGDLIFGGGGRDLLRGQWGNDYLYGQEGHDLLEGGEGDDSLAGGKGNDWLQGDDSGDSSGRDTYVFRPGDGFDYIYTLDQHDTLKFVWADGTPAKFSMVERNGNAVIVYGDGGTDDDTVYTYYEVDEDGCWRQADTPDGGAGGGTVTIGNMSLAQFKASGMGVTVYGGDGKSILHGTSGRDKLYGGKGDDKLKGKGNDDSLYGQDGNDRLYGQAGNDRLFGGDGDDRLYGGKGDDLMVGMAGNDTMTGGAGADQFVFRNGDGNDRITDFLDGDLIRLLEVGHGYDGLTIVDDADGNAVITYGGENGGTITLVNVAAGDLGESDFLFA